MSTNLRVLLVAYFSIWAAIVAAQQAPTANNAVGGAKAVPMVINYGGTLADANGKPLSGIQGATFLLYRSQEGGPPLWMETQNITPGRNGQYTATLRSMTNEGLPADLFSSGEARWLAVQVGGQPEQARVLLVAVPYALKAADAETIGGLPPSAFVLAPTAGVANQGSGSSVAGESSVPALTSGPTEPRPTPPPPANPTVTGIGTVNTLPLWDSTSDIVSSAVTQTGTGASTYVGINVPVPATTLDVGGIATVRGALFLPPTGSATARAGTTSQAENLIASSYNSSTRKAVNQTFQFKAEPAANNTTSPSGTLNLLFGANGATPTETGFNIASNGNVGIGVLGPAVPLHVMGMIRSETGGLSLGGNAPLQVDAPYISGGRFPILPNGFVGINNPTPATNLDIVGSVNASVGLSTPSIFTEGLNVGGGSFTKGITTDGRVTATGAISTQGNLSGSTLTIGQDPPLSAAPRMHFSGFFAGNVVDGQIGGFMVPTSNIMITRTGLHFDGDGSKCSFLGVLNVMTGSYPGQTLLQRPIRNPSGNLMDDGPYGTTCASGFCVAAGTPIFLQIMGTPSCGIGGGVGNIMVNIEYMMQ